MSSLKSIKQIATFSAEPEQVYQLLMNAEKYSAFTGSNVITSKEINGTFNVFGGYIEGYNIELVEGEKIVQAWHFVEDGWADDHYSICTFLFEKVGGKTRLIFKQTGIPEHKVDSLKGGWKQYYWEPMKNYLKKTQ